MPSCLGIQIENNIIKYAKVQQEKDSIKVEAFNVMFYENLENTLTKIIEETNSFKTPIAVNLSDERYDYFQASALLNSNYRKSHVETEFEVFCEENKINRNTIETRYLFTTEPDNSDMIRVVAVSANQADLEQKKLNLADYKLEEISPLSTTIANLIERNEKENSVIINIENKTEITTILKGEIVKIDSINEGMGEILEKINLTENSIQKSYEVCKNTTIYTHQGTENITEGNEHLDSIMPTLNSIAEKVKNIVEMNGIGISKVYITGLATAINNIDLYFQDFFTDVKCEVLRPFFSNTSSIKTSIKDYIEVNSAIALALNGIGFGFEELNFASKKTASKGFVKKANKPSISEKKIKSKSSGNTLTGTLEPMEWLFIRIAIALLIIIIGYILVTNSINNQIQENIEVVTAKISETDMEVKKVESDIKIVQDESEEYGKKVEELEKLKENGLSTIIIPESAIPNLLYRLIEITPRLVQIISIENTEGTHIVINAKSEYYEQLGFLIAALSNYKINDDETFLLNLKSTSGVKKDGYVNVIIEGDLPTR